MANIYNPYFYPQQPTMNQQYSGLIPVPSEADARNYPLAFGVSMSFKDENAPFIYVKTMGRSQFDLPTFEKYRLVKEEAKEEPKAAPAEDFGPEIAELRKELEAIRFDVEEMKIKKAKKKTEDENE